MKKGRKTIYDQKLSKNLVVRVTPEMERKLTNLAIDKKQSVGELVRSQLSKLDQSDK